MSAQHTVIREQSTASAAKRYENPIPTTDAIVEYELPDECLHLTYHMSGVFRMPHERDGLILIERLNPPYGLALPGGFAEKGLCFEENMRKESGEEIGLELAIYNAERPLRVQSHPQRDPRAHIGQITANVYVGQGSGMLRAGDDAKRVYHVTMPQVKELMRRHWERKSEGYEQSVFAFDDHVRALDAYVTRREFLERHIVLGHRDDARELLMAHFYCQAEYEQYVRRNR